MLTARMNRFFPEMTFRSDVDRLMHSVLTPHAEPAMRSVFPTLNIMETEQAFLIEAELPGFALANLEISMTGPDLTISGSREEKLPENATLHRAERSAGASKFSRVLRVNTPVDAEKVSATLDAGVLTITLPKTEAAKPRKIEVRTV